MREQLEIRLTVLKQELQKGQVELQKVENQRTYLHETMLRISGAIQVLEDLLKEEQTAGLNGTASPEKDQPVTTHLNGNDSRQA